MRLGGLRPRFRPALLSPTPADALTQMRRDCAFVGTISFGEPTGAAVTIAALWLARQVNGTCKTSEHRRRASTTIFRASR